MIQEALRLIEQKRRIEEDGGPVTDDERVFIDDVNDFLACELEYDEVRRVPGR